jgi:hypothetical protein
MKLENRITKTQQVLDHLKQGHPITSLMAINLYGATRLSSIIFNLKDRGYDITSEKLTRLDRNGNVCNFAVYKLHGVLPIDVKDKLNTNPEKQNPQPEKENKNFFKKLWDKIF